MKTLKLSKEEIDLILALLIYSADKAELNDKEETIAEILFEKLESIKGQ